MSRLLEIHEDMQAEWTRLKASWQVAREKWHDGVAESFERGRWQEWEKQTPALLRALEELEAISSTALRDIR